MVFVLMWGRSSDSLLSRAYERKRKWEQRRRRRRRKTSVWISSDAFNDLVFYPVRVSHLLLSNARVFSAAAFSRLRSRTPACPTTRAC